MHLRKHHILMLIIVVLLLLLIQQQIKHARQDWAFVQKALPQLSRRPLLKILQQDKSLACWCPEFLQKFYMEEQQKRLLRIYAVTPTYERPEQKAELIRLSQLFMLLPHLFWIVVEDSNTTSPTVNNVLVRAGLSERSIQLNVTTPLSWQWKIKDAYWYKPRGVLQRNIALYWIRSNVDAATHSLVYFMDDDNTYSVDLFLEMQKILPGRVGVWPVGLVGGQLVEKPFLNADNTKVLGFNSRWRPERPFAIDMAGFAIAIDLLFQYPQAMFSFQVDGGYQESFILQQLTEVNKLQPLASNCSEVLVWHTRTEQTLLSEDNGKPKVEKSSKFSSFFWN